MGWPSEGKTVKCAIHGDQQETCVCQHILAGLDSRLRVGFFWAHNDTSNKRPDAYCNECNERAKATGGEWIGEALEHLAPKCLCGECYDLAKRFHSGGGRLT